MKIAIAGGSAGASLGVPSASHLAGCQGVEVTDLSDSTASFSAFHADVADHLANAIWAPKLDRGISCCGTYISANATSDSYGTNHGAFSRNEPPRAIARRSLAGTCV